MKQRLRRRVRQLETCRRLDTSPTMDLVLVSLKHVARSFFASEAKKVEGGTRRATAWRGHGGRLR